MTASLPELALETQLIQCGITGWEREVRFHQTRKWRFDFSFPAEMLAVEVEGATWQNGRHTRGGGFAEDCIKYAEAVLLGYRVLRFTSEQVYDGTAVKYIAMAVGAGGAT